VSRLNLEMQEITASALYGEINRGMRNLKSPEIHTGPPDVQLAKAWRCARSLIAVLAIVPFMSEAWRTGLRVLAQKLDAFCATVDVADFHPGRER